MKEKKIFKCPHRILAIHNLSQSDLALKWNYNRIVTDHVENAIKLEKQGFCTFIKVKTEKLSMPFDEGYEQALQNLSIPTQGFYWTSPLFEECDAYLLKHQRLHYELILKELETLEKVFVNKTCLYVLPQVSWVTAQHLKIWQQHAGPQLFFLYEAKEYVHWHSLGEKCLPILKMHDEDAPLFLPKMIDKYLLRSQGGCIELSPSFKGGLYLDGHMHCLSKALTEGQSPHTSFREWLKINHSYLDENAIEWTELVSDWYLNVEKLLETKNQDEIKSVIDTLIIEWRLKEKDLEKNLKRDLFHSQKKQFWKDLVKFLEVMKESVRMLLKKHQISIPLSLQSD